MKKLILFHAALVFSFSVTAATIKIEKCEPVTGKTPKNGWNKPDEIHQCDADVHTLECSAGGSFVCDWTTPPSFLDQHPSIERYVASQVNAGILRGSYQETDGSVIRWDATVTTWLSIEITTATQQCFN